MEPLLLVMRAVLMAAFGVADLVSSPVGTAPEGALVRGAVRVVVDPAVLASRVEHFRVSRNIGAEPAEEVAVIRLARLDGVNHTLLERDVVLRDDGWILHLTERLEGCSRRLNWREIGPAGRRTWTVDWRLDASDFGTVGAVVGYGWARPVHESLIAEAPLMGELEWFEALRSRALVAPAGVIDPLRSSAPSLGADPLVGEARKVALLGLGLGDDGAGEVDVYRGPSGTVVLHGGALYAFAFAGGWARPCSAEEFDASVARWRFRPRDRHPAVEAALRRDETLRTMGRLMEAGHRVRWR